MANARAVTILHVIVATALAVGLLVLGAAAAEKYGLPFIHGWALAHGTVFVVLPVYFLLFYLSLRPIARRLSILPVPSDPVPARRVSLLAVSSLVFSGLGFVIPLVGSIIGIIWGHRARRQCRTDSNLDGCGLAWAGLILGYLGLGYSLFVVGKLSLAYLTLGGH